MKPLFESSVLRYLGVGGTAFVVDFALTVAARDFFHLPLWLAVAIGFWAGFLVNFGLQRNFTFRSDRSYTFSLILYFALVGFNWAVTTAMMYLLVDLAALPTWLGKIICTLATTIWNYPIYRFIVFPSPDPVSKAPSRELPAAIDVIVPAHNSGNTLSETVDTLHAWSAQHGVNLNILVVENGSTDNTAEVIATLSGITALTSETGLGHAYQAGIAASTAELLLLSADDLPFGTSDLDTFLAHPMQGVLIGSKAHPDSKVDRESVRTVASRGFRLLRRVILGQTVGDTQGTVLLPGEWAGNLKLREPGFLSSTEIVTRALHDGLPVTEIPVTMLRNSPTRIRIADAVHMGLGLLRLLPYRC